MKRQAWAFLASLGTTVMTITALARADLSWATGWGVASIALWLAARNWNRKSPKPFPYVLRWFLRLPRIGQSARQVKLILQPRRGERLLEVGPGIGTHALPVAAPLAPDGFLMVFDVQREMLNEIERRAAKAGITNIRSTQGDATRLPYVDRVFDGAYLIGVLGEIPDQDAALRELWRVLKPHGRLVIGEIFVDPDFSSLASVRGRMRRAGFVFRNKLGVAPAYLARFQRAEVRSAAPDAEKHFDG